MRWGHVHEGIDLGGPYGSPVLAVTDGIVVFAGQESGYGNFIELQLGDGTVTAYGHLATILVHVGQQVPAGFPIGVEGSTGHSTGPHLHFEVRVHGTPIDPIPWLRARGVIV
jgi:murein DD-endopeptidase MepM/ murein hydrolase activator NlpD